MVHRRSFFRRMILAGLLAIGCGVLPAAASKAGPAAPAPSTGPSRNVIVMLKDSVPSANPVAAEHARTRHARVKHVYSAALQGYAATVPDDQLAALRSDSRVEAVVEDKTTHFEQKPNPSPGTFLPQLLPYGVQRVGADISSTKAGDGKGRVDADVAIIDSGVGPHHDLNIVGGVNCGNFGKPSDSTDHLGHGTHVAGIAGAIDNRRDYVGTAPGVRIWSVNTLNKGFDVSLSSVLCGIEWVTRHADVIDVANLSLGFPDMPDDGNCGRTNHDPLHRAVCRMVRAGVTTVVSAGNEARDAATNAPASYDEVITVSAITDCDGVPGGLDRDGKCAQNPDYCFHQHDDTPASFTSFGADVDLIAPGVCVFSLWPFDFAGQPDPDGYNILSGTSMSAPHVTGAAALYKSRHPHASPAQVRATLIAAGSFNYDGSWDPDGIKEPLLNMASL